jgi:hypothetical protein
MVFGDPTAKVQPFDRMQEQFLSFTGFQITQISNSLICIKQLFYYKIEKNFD